MTKTRRLSLRQRVKFSVPRSEWGPGLPRFGDGLPNQPNAPTSWVTAVAISRTRRNSDCIGAKISACSRV